MLFSLSWRLYQHHCLNPAWASTTGSRIWDFSLSFNIIRRILLGLHKNGTLGARNKSTGRAKLLLRTSVDFISLTLAFCACLFLHAYRLNFVFHYTSFALSDALPLCLLHFYTSCKTLIFTAALHPRGSCTGGVLYSTLLFIFVVRLLFPLGFGSGVSLERARVCVCLLLHQPNLSCTLTLLCLLPWRAVDQGGACSPWVLSGWA